MSFRGLASKMLRLSNKSVASDTKPPIQQGSSSAVVGAAGGVITGAAVAGVGTMRTTTPGAPLSASSSRRASSQEEQSSSTVKMLQKSCPPGTSPVFVGDSTATKSKALVPGRVGGASATSSAGTKARVRSFSVVGTFGFGSNRSGVGGGTVADKLRLAKSAPGTPPFVDVDDANEEYFDEFFGFAKKLHRSPTAASGDPRPLHGITASTPLHGAGPRAEDVYVVVLEQCW